MTRRVRTPGDDDGFALPFVLMVILMVCLGVAGSFAVTTPNIANARTDANGQRASAAARAGVDDAEAWLEGDPLCRSTTRICAKALGADSDTLGRTALTALGTATRWRIDPTVTADGFVRVRSTATVDTSTRTVVADLALAPSILSFGYYSDFESISPDVLVDGNPARTIRLDNGSAYSSSTSSPKTLTWNGLTGTDVAECGLHWWDDGSVKGRANSASTGYTEFGKNPSNGTISRTGLCDIVFTGGHVFDGPVYTRDAIYVSEDASGAGPIFNQPVVTGWGFGAQNSPAANVSMPWRRNNGSKTNCCLLSDSPQKPTIARFDLQLPLDIGTQGVAANACVYQGPTRAVLNGDGTATITSPRTTSAAAGSDSRCYPGDMTNGVVGFPVNYKSGVGGGTIIARNIGTKPGGGWSETAVRSTDAAATQAGSAMWLVAQNGGAANPTTSSIGDSACTTSTSYSANAGATCAWSELPDYRSTTPTDGWTASTPTASCAGLDKPTDQRQFECDLAAMPSATVTTYAAFRSAVKDRLTASPCSGTLAAQQTCVTTALKAQLPPDTAKARYTVVSTASTGPGAGTPVVGTAPATPGANDSLFTAGTSTTPKQTPTVTTLSYTVKRESLTNGAPRSPAVVQPQFSFTVTDTSWQATAGQATAYFPSLRDVTPYGTVDPTGKNVPGDLYVEGSNTGKVSLLADNDAVVTGDITDVSADPNKDAVNLVAGSSVRNYNPVSCVASAQPASITATSSGYCPNDVTGVVATTVNSDNTLNARSAPAQYTNIRAVGDRRIDAAIFALQGSFNTDNNDRGSFLGNVTVNGGVYQAHRGVNVNLYASGSYQARTGYILKYKYVDLRPAKLPYEPTTRSLSGRVWRTVSISGGGAS